MNVISNNFLAKYVIIAVLALGSSSAFSQVSLSIGIAPPQLPVYEQPACPYDGYLWTPGYWAYGDYGYYWVPGTWVQPPQVGLFWTPCYWGWGGNSYIFHSGYWGQNVGFYGGINYGYGYGGNGYGGGRWQGGQFSYNTAVNNVGSTNIRNRYADESAVNNNAGNGGVQAQATAQERQYSSERHVRATSAQQAQVRAASQDRGQLASANGGTPATLAAARPQAYTSIAQQRAKAQPLTQQEKVKKPGASSNGQANAETQTHEATQNTSSAENHETAVKPQYKTAAAPPAENHETAVKPQYKTAATQQTHSEPMAKPESHPAPQFHPSAQASPQSHPAAQAKPQPQSHPAAQAKPQAQAGKPQAH
jgi:hypothetical protein